jgi:diguanylate cyclase (GGDEF)-like protein
LIKTLQGFSLVAALAIALSVFLGTTLVTSLLYEMLIVDQSRATTRALANQTYNAMFDIMQQGGDREDLQRYLSRNREAFSHSSLQVEVFRAPMVEERFGVIEQPAMDLSVRRALVDGQQSTSHSDGRIRYVTPMTATDECLACHANAKAGDVLGVIRVESDLNPITTEVRTRYVALFSVLAALVLATAAYLSRTMVRRIDRSVLSFRDQVEGVHAVKDLKKLDLRKADFGFRELNELCSSVALLVDRMRTIAVDKDVLEFEMNLLSKLIITSEVVRDWKAYICGLLLDINDIVDAYTLFTLFRVDDESYEHDVFWRGQPSDECKALFEEIVRRRIREHPHFSQATTLLINHHVADPESVLPELTGEDIELQTKTLLLETPRIGGVAGIGVQAQMAKDPICHIVVGGILTTLLNMVGSVKAIYKYTRDLEYYATRDPLTDLHNQRVFWELLEYEVNRAKRHGYRFGVIVVDLDNFKTINDRYGHAFGDRFLQAFADTLREVTRQGDALVRYGGDEFTVILPESDEEQVYLVGSRIRDGLEKLTVVAPDQSRVKATTSIGVAVYPKHGKDSRELFLVADNMMYKAKRGGKNAIGVPTEADLIKVFRSDGEKSQLILNALEQRTIVPLFQPIVDARSAAVEVHELLMRIQVGDALIPASEFVDVAESIGVVHRMDYILIEKAFTQMREQEYRGMLFINLSPKALIVGEFIGRMRALAARFGIEPGRVVFEITERETVKNITLLEQFVLSLKLEGFKFAIDDFGSGFSSFQYIRRFPIDYIKIEGEFIRNMLSDERDLALVQSITALARGLGIKTVAEFVEDREVLEAVCREGADYAQGYYIGRPGPVLLARGTRVHARTEEAPV